MKNLLFILLLLFVFSCGENNKESIDDESSISDEEYFEEMNRLSYAVSPDKINTDTLSRTKLFPFIEAPIEKNVNSVYCISFQLAWNELKNYIGGDIELENQSEALNFLNQSEISKNDIDNKSIICLAGDSLKNHIRKEFKIKFNDEPEHLNNIPENLIAYAYLQKILKFKGKFETDQVNKINFKDQNEVWYFYYLINTNSLKTKNVVLYDYKSDNDFIIKTEVKESKDEVYFAKVKPNSTLFETYQMVLERIKKDNITKLDTNDIIGIPYVNFNIRKKFDYLSGKIVNSNEEVIDQAIQDVDFDLNETGITLISSFAITRHAIEIKGKRLLFDKPFLIILKQKYSKYPYFLIWLDNSELMKEHIF